MKTLLTVSALALSLTVVAAQQSSEDEVKRITESADVLGEIMAAGDKAIPRAILEKAQGIAVFPSLLKGGVFVGGQRGHGILSVRDANGGWSAPAFLTITGGSVGAQFGFQAIDLLLVVNDRRGLEQLVKNQFKLGADAGVAAGPLGREATAQTDIQMRAKILGYSRARGLFAGVTLNGSTVREDRDANKRFYGTAFHTADVVFKGMGGAPEPVAAWRDTLVKHGK
jgi:lipid-binding SYLF domain-containing protein